MNGAVSDAMVERRAPARVRDEFAEFFEAVHGFEPFPWQVDAVESILSGAAWPDLVDVPTGLGKTAMMDVFVYVTAMAADHAPAVARRRCFFVIDRRIVVDEAHEHALALASALAGAKSGIVADVAQRLAALGNKDPAGALSVTKMRGGEPWSQAWAERPDQVSIVVSTVDQVGSRMLFRGYGVSDRRQPVEAAFVGNDSVVLVDEAHLSTNFLDTAEAVRAEQSRSASSAALPGLDIVRLSATAPSGQREATEMPNVVPFDVEAHRASPTAARRLNAAKRLHLLSTEAKKVEATLAHVAAGLANSGRRVTSGSAPVAMVVCNTVDSARQVFDILRAGTRGRRPKWPDLDVELLIGRSRPVDRREREAEVLARFGKGAARTERPAILVATQTVEVGVNLDVDALVTESASWSAIVQRLGRLNRFGDLGERLPNRSAATAVVVHGGAEDFVYGEAAAQTWTWLSTKTAPLDSFVPDVAADGLDVSPLACRNLQYEAGPDLNEKPAPAPFLTSSIIERWTRTGPIPTADPPVGPYLHGLERVSASVNVLWRAGLRATSDATHLTSGGVLVPDATADRLLSALPPWAGEQIEVPIAAVRRWMSGQQSSPVSDLEVAPEATVPVKQPRDAFSAFAYRPTNDGDQAFHWEQVEARDLKPGETIVVPVECGGLDMYGWNPGFDGHVHDVAEASALDAGGLTLVLDNQLPVRLGLVKRHIRPCQQIISAIRSALSGVDDPDTIRRGLSAVKEPDDVDAGSESIDVDALTRESLAGLTTHFLDFLIAHVEERDPDGRTRAEGADGSEANESSDTRNPAWGPRRADLKERLKAILESRGRRKRIEPVAIWRTEADIERAELPLGLITWRPPRQADGTSWAPDESDPSATAVSPRGATVTLESHGVAVRERAEEIAIDLGLPDDLVRVIGDAAEWHDLGKAEERFQAMLHGGDAWEALIADAPLAKSGMDPNDPSAWRRARELSGLPAGARHEAWSGSLVQAHVADHGYSGDVDLLVHLVASHHGLARPWLPAIVDDERLSSGESRPISAVIRGHAVEISPQSRDDLGQFDRFTRLNARYGPWGLALLEAIVRCADTTISREGR